MRLVKKQFISTLLLALFLMANFGYALALDNPFASSSQDIKNAGQDVKQITGGGKNFVQKGADGFKGIFRWLGEFGKGRGGNFLKWLQEKKDQIKPFFQQRQAAVKEGLKEEQTEFKNDFKYGIKQTISDFFTKIKKPFE